MVVIYTLECIYVCVWDNNMCNNYIFIVIKVSNNIYLFLF